MIRCSYCGHSTFEKHDQSDILLCGCECHVVFESDIQ